MVNGTTLFNSNNLLKDGDPRIIAFDVTNSFSFPDMQISRHDTVGKTYTQVQVVDKDKNLHCNWVVIMK